ncbi:MAG: hypothetical protein H7301_06380 [Cryobacterium sp.]|nr:hypothetical protein [Oligoflexia bacterium]
MKTSSNSFVLPFLFTLALAASQGAAPAQADQVVRTFPGGDTKSLLESPNDAKSQAEEASDNAGGAIKMKKECKTASGSVTIKGDAAYERCLKEKLEKPRK